jgi:flagellar FliJ protein
VGFKFRYETLLSYRGHLKEKAEVELGKAQSHLSRARQLLEYYEKQLHETRRSLEKGLSARMSSAEMITYSEYLAGTKRRISAQKLEVGRWERIASERRKNLLSRTKEYRIIEKLKEKDVQKWNQQQAQLELKGMNEVALTRYGRDLF